MPATKRRRKRRQPAHRPTAPAITNYVPHPSSTTKEKRSSPLRSIAALALFILISSSIGLLWTAGQPADPATALPANTLVEFADFQCPYCAAFAANTLPRLYDDYITPGKMQYQFRHYPFLGESSYQAAHAAECAREQEAFGPYHDKVFEKLLEGHQRPNHNQPDLAGIAEQIELNQSQWQECMNANRYSDRVSKDKALGRSLGVPGTPALFLNGETIQNSLLADYSALSAKIDRLLEAETTQ